MFRFGLQAFICEFNRQNICSAIGHILEHEFFCLGCLGSAGSKEKKWIWVFLGNFWGCFFQLFEGKKMNFFWKHCRKFPHFFDIFDDFFYCWTFEIFHLHICLLLNLWTFFTAQPLRLSVAAEPLRLCPGLCICLLLNLWIFLLLNIWDYALDYVSVWCWSFENVQQ